MVTIGDDLMKKLERMIFLCEAIKSESDDADYELFDEYERLSSEVSREFKPALTLLAQSGVLGVYVVASDPLSSEKKAVHVGNYDVEAVIDNGSLWLKCGAAMLNRPFDCPP